MKSGGYRQAVARLRGVLVDMSPGDPLTEELAALIGKMVAAIRAEKREASNAERRSSRRV
jgi:hypothetical protein